MRPPASGCISQVRLMPVPGGQQPSSRRWEPQPPAPFPSVGQPPPARREPTCIRVPAMPEPGRGRIASRPAPQRQLPDRGGGPRPWGQPASCTASTATSRPAPNVGLSQGGRIVDAVANYAHLPVFGLQPTDLASLGLGQHLGRHTGDADPAGDRRRGAGVVPGHHHDWRAELAPGGDSQPGNLPSRVYATVSRPSGFTVDRAVTQVCNE